jgi:thiamine pyrophosphokinase
MKKKTFLNDIFAAEELILLGPCPSNYIKTNNFDSPLLIIDGGLNQNRESFTSKSSLSIGDNDSNTSTEEVDLSYSAKKDKSDLKLALELISNSELKKLRLIGLSGGRLDHEMANFGELSLFLNKSPHTKVINIEDKLSILTKGTHDLDYRGSFSLLSIFENKIQLQGACEYQLFNETPMAPLSSLGLSNNAFGKFTLKNTQPILIFWN